MSKIELQTNLSEDYAPAVPQLMMCAGGAVLRQQDGRHAGQVHLLPDHRHPVLRQHAGGDDDANDDDDDTDDDDDGGDVVDDGGGAVVDAGYGYGDGYG